MVTATNLSTSRVAGQPGHVADSNIVHQAINELTALASQGLRLSTDPLNSTDIGDFLTAVRQVVFAVVTAAPDGGISAVQSTDATTLQLALASSGTVYGGNAASMST